MPTVFFSRSNNPTMAVTVRAHRKHGSHGGIVMVKKHKRSHPVTSMYVRRPMHMHKRRSPTHKKRVSHYTSRMASYSPSRRSSTGSVAQSLRMYGRSPYVRYGTGIAGLGALGALGYGAYRARPKGGIVDAYRSRAPTRLGGYKPTNYYGPAFHPANWKSTAGISTQTSFK